MEINKKITMGLLSLLLILLSISLVSGIKLADSAKLSITLISQEPDPAEPGQILDVRFKVENLGGGGTDNIIFELLPEYPFSLYKGSAVRNIGSLQAYQSGEEGIIIHYKLRVNEGAIEGDNYINIKYKFGEVTNAWRHIKDFVIRIRTADIVLLIDEVRSSPSIIPPGENAKLRFKIKNPSDSLVKDLKIKLELGPATIPFVPIRSTTEKKIYQISSNNESEIIFDIMAMPDADAGAYKIPINISYSDLAGTKYQREDLISLVIGTKPDIYVGIDETDIYKGKKSGTVTIKFVNKGLTDIKFLNVRLRNSKDYEIISPAEVYIGNVDSDDYETVDFNIYIKSRKDSINLPLIVEYLDANNRKYSPIKNIELKMYSSMQAKKYGIVKSSKAGAIFFVLLILGGFGFYYWRCRKKKKKLFGKWEAKIPKFG